ncbi:phage tail protein [Paenibacillus cellulositrophicus]|uniref:phage tail protein n=1 Tax=Paenibacillus TaxID=44249 RepID=UPI0013D6714F|nr:tail fiber protein [Paenibacillus favisporus]
MTEAYIGEIRLFSFNFVPQGWHLCDGSLLQINQNTPLYSILGTTYGGNGTTTFALPDLRGRAPVHAAPGVVNLGEIAGEENHILTESEMPAHNHLAKASNVMPTTSKTATGNTWGNVSPSGIYSSTSNAQMKSSALTTAGSGQPHSNMQPFITANYCIAITGYYPPRS